MRDTAAANLRHRFCLLDDRQAGLSDSRKSTTEDLYIYGHNYVAYKEGVYLGYKYFETFCPEKVVYPFGFGLSYTDFQWTAGALQTGVTEYGELCFSVNVVVKNIGKRPARMWCRSM